MIFQFSNEIELWHKEFLNFGNPLTLDISMFLDNEKKMGE